jgi:hypothetical protein
MTRSTPQIVATIAIMIGAAAPRASLIVVDAEDATVWKSTSVAFAIPVMAKNSITPSQLFAEIKLFFIAFYSFLFNGDYFFSLFLLFTDYLYLLDKSASPLREQRTPRKTQEKVKRNQSRMPEN